MKRTSEITVALTPERWQRRCSGRTGNCRAVPSYARQADRNWREYVALLEDGHEPFDAGPKFSPGPRRGAADAMPSVRQRDGAAGVPQDRLGRRAAGLPVVRGVSDVSLVGRGLAAPT